MTNSNSKSYYHWNWETKFVRLQNRLDSLPSDHFRLIEASVGSIRYFEVVEADLWHRRTKLSQSEFMAQIDLLLYHQIVAPIDDDGFEALRKPTE